MKLLKPDSGDVLLDALTTISLQLSNSSTRPFQQTPFTPPSYAVRVNYYFFAALSCSLIAVLAAVIALQWAGSYDSGLVTTSAEDRAVQRQFRYDGVEKWKMNEIITMLPALVFVALFLFFIGLAEWLWNIHHGIAAVVSTGLSLGACFFFATTTVSVIAPSSPYRTQISKTIASIGSAFGKAGGKGRELGQVHETPSLKSEALLWLSNTLEISPYSNWQFISILEEIIRLPPEQLNRFQWDHKLQNFILDVLCAPYEVDVFARPPPSFWRADDQDLAEFTARCIATFLVTHQGSASVDDQFDKQRLLRVLAILASNTQLSQLNISSYPLLARSLSDANIYEALEVLFTQHNRIPTEFYELALHKLRDLIKNQAALPGVKEEIARCLRRLCVAYTSAGIAVRPPLPSTVLGNLMMLICQCAFPSRHIPTSVGLDQYLEFMEPSIPMPDSSVSMHRAIGDEYAIRLRRVTANISEAENALSDMWKLTSWHPDLPRNSMIPVVVEDVLNVLDCFKLGSSIRGYNPFTSFRLSHLAVYVLFDVTGLSHKHGGNAIHLLANSPKSFTSLICALDGQMERHGEGGEWQPAYKPDGPASDSLRINITQFITRFCMPMYQENRESWKLEDDDIKRLSEVKDLNVALQLSLVKQIDVALSLPGLEDPIWEDHSWHISVFRWCLSTGEEVRKGTHKAIAKSLVSSSPM